MVYSSEEDGDVYPLVSSQSNLHRAEETTGPYRDDETRILRIPPRYPKAVIFVLTSKFLEAFAANGLRTVLALYLRDDLNLSETLSTVILHIFNFFGQFCPIVGAILADSYCGNAKSIGYFYIIYACGWTGLITTSFPLHISVNMIISLLFISIGNGSIRACITSLGAMQFQLPEQNTELTRYFSHYYFAYYFGIFLGKIMPPSIRSNTSCFEKDICYPAVFGTLGTMFFMSWIAILFGQLLLRVCGCIKHAICTRFRQIQRQSCNQHWLDYAVDKYGVEFVENVKIFIKISQLFLPLVIYWAMLAQQDSSWTFQATQMDTMIFGMHIEPDHVGSEGDWQAKAMAPIFLFTLIWLWQYLIYPRLNRSGIYIHPLHSVAIGGICSASAFICAGLLQIQIESYPSIKFNILWQIPQFLLLMTGELFLSIPGLQFTFTQAPACMKSVLTAGWFVNNSFGNLVVVALTKLKIVSIQSSEYFLYSIMMFASVILFTFLASDYIRRRY